MLDAGLTEADLKHVAERLVGDRLRAMAHIPGGGNNRVYRLETNRECYALKLYPANAADRRDRLGVEFGALTFLKTQGVKSVPGAIASDPDNRCALYEWISGAVIPAPDNDDIDAALSLVRTIHSLRLKTDAAELPEASARCLSGQDVVAQIAARRDRLGAVAGNDPFLRKFLTEEFDPSLRHWTHAAHRAYEMEGLDFGGALARDRQTLSLSDFGFHNALRRNDGKLVFLDLEYFGWDDPAKLVSDFVHHRGMALCEPLQKRFVAGASAIFGGDPYFATRLRALHPLFGLIWCLIALNEYLPEIRARRISSGMMSADQTDFGERVSKARKFFHELARARDVLFQE